MKRLEQLTWAYCVMAVLILALRWFAFDAHVVSVWVNSFYPFLLLPGILVTLVAASKRMSVAGISAVALFCQAAVALPAYDRRETNEPEAASRLIIYSANLMMGPLPMSDINDMNPDVILLQEFTAEATVTLTQYPYRFELPRTDAFGMAIYSKTPLSERRTIMLDEIPALSATVSVGGKPVEVLNVHTLPPINSAYFGTWNKMFTGMHKYLRNIRHPIVVAGDFNATQYSKHHQQLLANGLRSTHQIVGRDHATTFPNNQRWLPPIRLDHVFISSEVICEKVVEGVNPLSDHKPIIARLVLNGT